VPGGEGGLGEEENQLQEKRNSLEKGKGVHRRRVKAEND